MLTPSFINSLKSTPTPGGVSNNQSMNADQANSWISSLTPKQETSTSGNNISAVTPTPSNPHGLPTPSILKPVQDFATNYGNALGNDYSNAVSNFMSAASSGQHQAGEISPSNPVIPSLGGKPESALGAAGQNIIEGSLRATSSGLNTIFAPISEAINTAVNSNTGQAIANSPQMKGILDAVNGLQQKYSAWASQNPEHAKDLEAGLNIAGTAIGGKVEPTVNAGIKAGVSEAGNITSDVGSLASKTMNKVTEPVTNAVSDATSGLKNKVVDMATQSEQKAWAKPSTLPAGFNKAKDIYQTAQSQGHDISQSLVNSGIKLSDHIETAPTGRKVFDTADTAQKIHQDAAKMSNKMLRSALTKADSTVPLTPVKKLISNASKNIQSAKITEEAKYKMMNSLNESKISLQKKFPQGMKLSDLHDEKIVRDTNSNYSPVGDIATNAEALKNKFIADAARKMVEQKAPEEIPVKDFNAALAKQHQMANYLDSINGKKVPSSKLSNAAHWAGKVTGAGIGSSLGGGVMGSLGGYHLGGIVESLIEEIPTYVRSQLLNNLKTANPEAFDKIQSYLSNLSDQTPKATAAATTNSGGNAANSNKTPITNSNLNIQRNNTTFTPKSQIVKGITNYVKNPKLGLSVNDITEKVPKALKQEVGDIHTNFLKMINDPKLMDKLIKNPDAYQNIDTLMTKLENAPTTITKDDVLNARESVGIIRGIDSDIEGLTPKSSPLIQEDKKYKSADEFVKAHKK